MRINFSLAPGFSPVNADMDSGNRFNGFPRAGKPLKRLTALYRTDTRLKPGVNEMNDHANHSFQPH